MLAQLERVAMGVRYIAGIPLFSHWYFFISLFLLCFHLRSMNNKKTIKCPETNQEL